MEQSHTAGQDERQTELEATVRPSASSLLPASTEPETREQRMGAERNGAYQEKVTVQQVDPREEAERRRRMLIIGLEVALALGLLLARRIWGWTQEERARARVDRELRRRIPAT